MDGQVVAYACASISFDEGEILRIGVLPAFRRQGIGETVWARMLAQLQSRGVEKVFLEVRASNEPAKALYGKLGFQQVGRRPNYYRNPKEDALILRKEWGK